MSDPFDTEVMFLPLVYRVIGGRLNRVYHLAPGKCHCVEESGVRTDFRDEHRARDHLTKALREALASGAAKVDIQVTKG